MVFDQLLPEQAGLSSILEFLLSVLLLLSLPQQTHPRALGASPQRVPRWTALPGRPAS